MRFFILMLFALFMGGCDTSALAEKFSSPEIQAEARQHIDSLRRRDYTAVERAIDEPLRGPGLHAELAKMANMIPAGEPTSVRLIGARKGFVNDSSTVSSTFEYLFGRKSVVIALEVRETDGVRRITEFHVLPQAVPVDERKSFPLDDAGFAHYAMLLATIAAFAVSLIALVKCVRTKGLQRKWLWILAIIVGLGKISLNWNTGELGVWPVAFQILSASYSTDVLGPTILAFSLPVGALVFLSRYRKNSPIHAPSGTAADQA